MGYRFVSLVVVGWLAVSPVLAADAVPGLLYDIGGRFDGSFNEAAYDGAERFKLSTGNDFMEFAPTTEAQREQGLRAMARDGATIIVAVGFAQASAVETVAAELPDVKFTLVDGVVDAPNVHSVVFKEQEGSFLVGMLAAIASRTGIVGFVGGMDVPIIRKFACGYEQGAKHVDADAQVLVDMIGDTPAAWHDMVGGGELAKRQFERGADVVFAAAGAAGFGVYLAARDAGKLAIAVDSNHNYVYPGTMLTSMVKHVDVAVEEAYRAVEEDRWQAGKTVLGLAEDGVSWALDEYNRPLITAETEAAVRAAEAKIVSGEIVVVDYMASNSCEY